MYEEIMSDVHRQWLEEFDRKAAIRRQLPTRRRDGESRGRLGFLTLRRQRSAAPTGKAVARRYSQAQQCG